MMTAALEGRPLIIHGDGTQTRSFCFVSDLVDGLLLVALDPSTDGEVFNVGNPAEMTILELADDILRTTGSDAPIAFDVRRPGDPERRRPDIGKMRARYGWEPSVRLEHGLLSTAQAFAEQLDEARTDLSVAV
jgi:nucleoside-diphosphate-sugar epimerase